MKAALYLYALLMFLQCVDIYSTYYIIKNQKGKEANPIMDYMIKRYGLLTGLIAPKIFVFICAPAVLLQFIVTYVNWNFVCVMVGTLCVLYWGVAANNIKIARSK